MTELSVPVHTLAGETKGTLNLNPKVFGVPFSDPLVHQVAVAQLANKRKPYAHTKTRAEVRGGGRKPWKQKHTGRARHGSRRSPIWVGGGITFGPRKERNYAQKINKKMRQRALLMILSDKVKSDRLVVIEEWSQESKTKQLNLVLSKLPGQSRKRLLVTSPDDRPVTFAAKNLRGVESIGVGSLNVVDLLKYEYLIVPSKLIPAIEKRYGG